MLVKKLTFFAIFVMLSLFFVFSKTVLVEAHDLYPIQAYPLNGVDQLQYDRQRIALLFLIDESGGVNGQCPVSDEFVFVVDEQEKRYQIVKFYLSLLGSIYDQEYGLKDKSNLPEVHVGVAQFAQNVDLVYPFTPINHVYQKPLLLEEHRANIGVCHTDYIKALGYAKDEIEKIEADHYVIVLITDGSFRGSEVTWGSEVIWTATKDNQNDIRSAVEEELRVLKESSIDLYLFVLGYDQCVDENNCGLRSKNNDNVYEMRRGDLRAWTAWDNDNVENLVDLLDENHIVEDMTHKLQLGSSVSVDGLVEGRGNVALREQYIPIPFPGWAGRQYVHVVLWEPSDTLTVFDLKCPTADCPYAKLPGEQQDASFFPRPQNPADLHGFWWRYDLTPVPTHPSMDYDMQMWNLKIQGTDGYIWLDPQKHIFDDPFVLDVNERQIYMNMFDKPKLSAYAQISPEAQIILNKTNCCKISFEITLEHEDRPITSGELPIVGAEVAYDFPLDKIGCPSRKGWLSAQLIGIGPESESQMVPLLPNIDPIELDFLFSPEVLTEKITISRSPSYQQGGMRCQCRCLDMTHVNFSEELYEITIPIQYATQNCNVDFSPTFVLTRTQQTESSPAGMCPNPQARVITPGKESPNGRFTIHEEVIDEETVNYILTLNDPSNESIASYWECGYDTLLVKMDGQLAHTIPYQKESSGSIDLSFVPLFLFALGRKFYLGRKYMIQEDRK